MNNSQSCLRQTLLPQGLSPSQGTSVGQRLRKLWVLAFISFFVLTGCSLSRISTINLDGSTCQASHISMFKSLTDVEMRACGSSGSANSSTSNEAVLTALINALRGLR